MKVGEIYYCAISDSIFEVVFIDIESDTIIVAHNEVQNEFILEETSLDLVKSLEKILLDKIKSKLILTPKNKEIHNSCS